MESVMNGEITIGQPKYNNPGTIWNRMAATGFITALLLVSVLGAVTNAQSVHLNIGDPAPEFEAVTDDGSTWNSSEYIGEQTLVVFFFPAAMTGGCTDQACSFRDNRTQLTEMGAEVVGISGDPAENLALFKRANNLNYPLLSDADGSIAGKFGVPTGDGGSITIEVDGEQHELSRELTTARWTFIINEEGAIAYVDSEVNASGDGEAVIAAIREMTQ